MKPALKWYGGKNKIARWVISHFPPHTCYTEAYGGAASVLLQKKQVTHEVYNDLDGEVVNFFRVLRTCPDDLVKSIALTPWSREEHKQSWEYCDDDIERARRFYIRCWQSYGAGTLKTPTAAGWQTQRGQRRGTTAIEAWRDIDRLHDIANRLLDVHIEHDEAIAVLQRFDSRETLHYVDPPYVLSTRYKSKVYDYEMSDEDHKDLAKCLQALDGIVVLSGYDNPLYNRLYAGWHKVTRTTTDRTSKSVQECLWLSPSLTRISALPLFARLKS